jgi:hypothetical protein
MGNTRGLCCAFVAVIGCGGGAGGDPGDPVSTDEAHTTCADFMAHAAECGWGGNINGADWNCAEAAVVWRADVFRDVASCANALSCTGDGATCLALAQGISPLPMHDAYATQCSARKQACNLVGTSDTSQLILSCNAAALAAYAKPVIDSVMACFDAACGDVVACLDSTL